MTPRLGILYGPTCSGKSALGMALAQRVPIVIINADAMQMYRPLRILTARPSAEEERAVPHALYGHLDAETHSNAALWLAQVVPEIRAAWAQQKLPLLVGGTGMYLKALQQGLARIPPIPDSVRAQVRRLHTAEAYEALQRADPLMAGRLKPGDTQRILRALEVIQATGASLAAWQAQPAASPLPEAHVITAALEPAREVLYAKINMRFDGMMQQGALEEVRALVASSTNHSTPIFKAHGVPELAAYLRGEMGQSEAIAHAQQHTRNYAKRQLTWARQQLATAPRITTAQGLEALLLS